MILVVEDLLIDKIKTLLPGRLRTVDSLPGDFTVDELKRLLISAPAVYVSFLGGQRDRRAGEFVLQSRWAVIALTNHASGQAARRRGDGQTAGAYEILDLLAPALDGLVIPDAGTVAVEQIRNLYSGAVDRQGLSAYALVLALPLCFPDTVDPATLDDFLMAHVDYDINQDGQADVADDVDLPQ